MKRKLTASIVSLVFLLSLPAGADMHKDGAHHASSAHGKMKMAEMNTPEMRQKMAKMHEQVATCLKSDRNMDECHQEMMKNCPMMKDGKCGMHGMMGMGSGGPHHHDMMKSKKPSTKQ